MEYVVVCVGYAKFAKRYSSCVLPKFRCAQHWHVAVGFSFPHSDYALRVTNAKLFSLSVVPWNKGIYFYVSWNLDFWRSPIFLVLPVVYERASRGVAKKSWLRGPGTSLSQEFSTTSNGIFLLITKKIREGTSWQNFSLRLCALVAIVLVARYLHHIQEYFLKISRLNSASFLRLIGRIFAFFHLSFHFFLLFSEANVYWFSLLKLNPQSFRKNVSDSAFNTWFLPEAEPIVPDFVIDPTRKNHSWDIHELFHCDDPLRQPLSFPLDPIGTLFSLLDWHLSKNVRMHFLFRVWRPN